jgi:hypothetical protein
MTNGGAAAAAAAAAAARRRAEEEEETMYTGQDLGEGWEFKILRANTRAFRHPDNLKQACDEEGQNGWDLLEKLDDSRLRFKRPRKTRETASAGAIDPYRSHYGMDPTKLALIIVASIIGTLSIVFGTIAALVH